MRDEQCAHKMRARESTTYVRHSMRNKTTQSHWSNFLLNFREKTRCTNAQSKCIRPIQIDPSWNPTTCRCCCPTYSWNPMTRYCRGLVPQECVLAGQLSERGCRRWENGNDVAETAWPGVRSSVNAKQKRTTTLSRIGCASRWPRQLQETVQIQAQIVNLHYKIK